MTITLELTSDEESRLRENAARAGLDPAGYVRRLIDLAPEERDDKLPKTPSEAAAYWEREGVYGLFKDGADSPEFSHELRRRAGTRNSH